MTPNADLVILKNLIAYYVQRQRLVVLALLDICPKLLIWPENRSSIFGIDIALYVEAYEDRVEQLTTYESLHSGIWKHDWKYRQHGHGCRLTHLHTEEILEWDAPDPDAFDVGWFFAHLDWRMRYEADDPFVRAYTTHEMSYQTIRGFLFQPNFIQIKEQPNMYKWVGG